MKHIPSEPTPGRKPEQIHIWTPRSVPRGMLLPTPAAAPRQAKSTNPPQSSSPGAPTGKKRRKSPDRRLGFGALATSLVVHGIFIFLAIFFFIWWSEPQVDSQVDFVPGGGGGGSNGSLSSYRIQTQRQQRMATPTVQRRIVSLSATASFELPDAPEEIMDQMPMEIGSASLGLGGGAGGGQGTGIGPGRGEFSGAGVGSGPGTGRGFVAITPFGSSGGVDGLVGHYYDFKVDAAGKPVKSRWEIPDLCKVYRRFFNAGWDERILGEYQRSPNALVTSQITIPAIPATKAPTYFGAPETEYPAWCVHYKGEVVAPESGRFRFVVTSDDGMAVRFDNKQLISHHYCLGPGFLESPIEDLFPPATLPKDYLPHPQGYPASRGHLACSAWFEVRRGRSYPCEILIMETGYGGGNSAVLLLQKKGEEEKPLKLFRCGERQERQEHPEVGNPYNIPTHDPNSPVWEVRKPAKGDWAGDLR